MINDYILGILYGDGYLQLVDNRESLFFSTTHRELAEKVSAELIKNDIKHNRLSRIHDLDPDKQNYEILEIITTSDQVFWNI